MNEQDRKSTHQQDEFFVTYPEMPEPEDFDSNSLCRACAGGIGDGICSYHAAKGRLAIRRAQHIYRQR